MKHLLFTRLLFIFLFTFAGYMLGGQNQLIFAAFGLGVGIVVVLFEMSARKLSLNAPKLSLSIASLILFIRVLIKCRL